MVEEENSKKWKYIRKREIALCKHTMVWLCFLRGREKVKIEGKQDESQAGGRQTDGRGDQMQGERA